MKVCAQPGCPSLTDKTYCDVHQRAVRASREAGRPKTAARGYGSPHQRTRSRFQRRLNQGEVFLCAKCGKQVHFCEPWDLGHTADRHGYTGPEHQACNRNTKGGVPPLEATPA